MLSQGYNTAIQSSPQSTRLRELHLRMRHSLISKTKKNSWARNMSSKRHRKRNNHHNSTLNTRTATWIHRVWRPVKIDLCTIDTKPTKWKVIEEEVEAENWEPCMYSNQAAVRSRSMTLKPNRKWNPQQKQTQILLPNFMRMASQLITHPNRETKRSLNISTFHSVTPRWTPKPNPSKPRSSPTLKSS